MAVPYWEGVGKMRRSEGFFSSFFSSWKEGQWRVFSLRLIGGCNWAERGVSPVCEPRQGVQVFWELREGGGEFILEGGGGTQVKIFSHKEGQWIWGPKEGGFKCHYRFFLRPPRSLMVNPLDPTDHYPFNIFLPWRRNPFQSCWLSNT